MESGKNLKPDVPSTSGTSRPTSGTTVAGWLLLCFAIIPLSMAAHGDGHVYVVTGSAMFAAGVGLVVMSRLFGRRGGGRGPTAAAT